MAPNSKPTAQVLEGPRESFAFLVERYDRAENHGAKYRYRWREWRGP